MANLPDLWNDWNRPFASSGAWHPRQLDDFMNEAMSGLEMVDGNRTMFPSVDVEETDDHYRGGGVHLASALCFQTLQAE